MEQLDFTDILFPDGEPKLEQVAMISKDSIITAFYNGASPEEVEQMARVWIWLDGT